MSTRLRQSQPSLSQVPRIGPANGSRIASRAAAGAVLSCPAGQGDIDRTSPDGKLNCRPAGIFRPCDTVLSSRLYVPWSGRPRPDVGRLLAQIAAARFMSPLGGHLYRRIAESLWKIPLDYLKIL